MGDVGEELGLIGDAGERIGEVAAGCGLERWRRVVAYWKAGYRVMLKMGRLGEA